ncbi:MAG: ABC transporter permease [Actinobacteria bacterium]|nr:ABC transporter permease [Actinomycetota bacterium]
MTRYILKRLAGGLVSLFIVTLLVFFGTNLLPGDPATAILGKEATPQRLADLRQTLNLDESVFSRYLHWIEGIVHGELGHSITQGVPTLAARGATGTPVSELIGPALANTAVLASIALVLLTILSLTIGTLSALSRGSRFDTGTQVGLLVFIALPEFVLGTILITLFGFVWPVLPPVTLTISPTGLILPVATLVLGMLGVTARMVRIGVAEVLDTNYVANARLRGIPEQRVLRRHVLPNAIGPSLQALAIATGIFVGGVVVIEYLFGYPGIGTGFVSAVAGRDYPVVQAYALILAAAYIVANVVADTITALMNPKLRAAIG